MLTSNRTIASLTCLSLVALVSASCGSSEPGSPTSPSSLSSPGRLSVDTGVDGGAAGLVAPSEEGDEPTPQPVPGEPPPAAEPAPEPAPAPAPAPAPGPVDPNAPFDPGPPPRPGAPAPGAPAFPVPTPPNTHFRLMVKVTPEPVPHSGQPITNVAGCRDLKHTWFYEQVLHAETGIPVTITERENFFDGRYVNTIKETFQIGGNGTHRISSRWCSGYGIFHYAQTRFKGKDENGEAIMLSGPWVRLMAP